MESKVIDWDGVQIPGVLRDLPPGRYLIEPLDEPLELSAEEEAGLIPAMDDIDAGKGSSPREVVDRIRRK